MIHGALLPAIVIVPVSALLMIFVAIHLVRVTRHPKLPPSRRRIRQANTTLLLAAIPFLAIGLSLVNPDDEPRRLAFAWLTTICLLGMSIMLAMLDMLNTARLFRSHRRRLRADLNALRKRHEEES